MLRNRFLYPLYAAVALATIFVLLAFNFFLPPGGAYPAVVDVPPGTPTRAAAEKFEELGLVRSPLLLALAALIFNQSGVTTGVYVLTESANPLALAYRLTHGLFGIEPIRFVVFEGETVYDIALNCERYLLRCSAKEFLALAEDKEGYLFPDTYYLLPTISPREFVDLLTDNFDKKIEPLAEEIRLFGESLPQVLTMASIIEREARTKETRRVISGILWKRLAIGMPLQVDAAFNYVNGKNTFQLTTKDLATDSPYNTYTNRGLPPTPISNPGLDAIYAALEPTPTPYLFYLTGRSGEFYFAKTHEEHVRNKELHL